MWFVLNQQTPINSPFKYLRVCADEINKQKTSPFSLAQDALNSWFWKQTKTVHRPDGRRVEFDLAAVSTISEIESMNTKLFWKINSRDDSEWTVHFLLLAWRFYLLLFFFSWKREILNQRSDKRNHTHTHIRETNFKRTNCPSARARSTNAGAGLMSYLFGLALESSLAENWVPILLLLLLRLLLLLLFLLLRFYFISYYAVARCNWCWFRLPVALSPVRMLLYSSFTAAAVVVVCFIR